MQRNGFTYLVNVLDEVASGLVHCNAVKVVIILCVAKFLASTIELIKSFHDMGFHGCGFGPASSCHIWKLELF